MTAAIETFRCEKRQLTLSRRGCARLHESASCERPQPWEGRAACRLCRTGAENRHKFLGGPPPTPGPTFAAAEAWGPVCVRCRRISDRLIRQRLCPSCYNRQLEVVTGRNAKGNRPALTDVLRPHAVAIVDTDGRVSRAEEPLAASRLEVILATVKNVSGPVAFGWAAANA